MLFGTASENRTSGNQAKEAQRSFCSTTAVKLILDVFRRSAFPCLDKGCEIAHMSGAIPAV